MTTRPRIIVLTPVKNEEWILKLFLDVTTRFADMVVVADQHSSDATVDICRKYSSVHVIHNEDTTYDERSRQSLLIQEARRLAPGPRILLALDADEIMAADALDTVGWHAMLNADPGTVLLFHKPDLVGSVEHCYHYKSLAPIGFVDDGSPHGGHLIHSTRIPTPQHANRLVVAGSVVMHYGLVCPKRQESKVRHYSVVENIHRTSPFYQRRALYKSTFMSPFWKSLEPSESSWFSGWTQQGIDVKSYNRVTGCTWHDAEVLRFFGAYGCRRFWLDDIWGFDWAACQRELLAAGIPGISTTPLAIPPRVLLHSLAVFDKCLNSARGVKRALTFSRKALDERFNGQADRK